MLLQRERHLASLMSPLLNPVAPPQPIRWSNLQPELGLVAALQHAGTRPLNGTQIEKRKWSEALADGCAVMIADEFRRKKALRYKRILPRDLASGTEPLTPLGSGETKRIDVTVADAVLGLELGVSLKAFNFLDSSGNNYDKNLTGRLYELGDEVRMVHEHLPHAFMVGVLFLPLAASSDKGGGNSSFANAVVKLRSRSGRLDASLPGQLARCDAGFVALYSPDLSESGYEAGVVRFFDVATAPPRRGRPTVESTLSLSAMVDEIVARATWSKNEEWSEPEIDL